MPDTPAKPTFMVDTFTDPVMVRIDGRASFANSGSLRDFFAELIKQGKSRFVVDFRSCTSMDSTFLGVLAGAALELKKLHPAGTLVAARLGPRNLELLRNLGLHRLLIVDTGDTLAGADAMNGKSLAAPKPSSEVESARLVLEAHEALVAADPENQGKFQDVLVFLKNRIQQG